MCRLACPLLNCIISTISDGYGYHGNLVTVATIDRCQIVKLQKNGHGTHLSKIFMVCIYIFEPNNICFCYH